MEKTSRRFDALMVDGALSQTGLTDESDAELLHEMTAVLFFHYASSFDFRFCSEHEGSSIRDLS